MKTNEPVFLRREITVAAWLIGGYAALTLAGAAFGALEPTMPRDGGSFHQSAGVAEAVPLPADVGSAW